MVLRIHVILRFELGPGTCQALTCAISLTTGKQFFQMRNAKAKTGYLMRRKRSRMTTSARRVCQARCSGPLLTFAPLAYPWCCAILPWVRVEFVCSKMCLHYLSTPRYHPLSSGTRCHNTSPPPCSVCPSPQAPNFLPAKPAPLAATNSLYMADANKSRHGHAKVMARAAAELRETGETCVLFAPAELGGLLLNFPSPSLASPGLCDAGPCRTAHM